MKGKIFNAQEVQAIIAGNKTQFREVIKPKLDDRANCGLGIHDNGQLLWDARDDCGYYKNYDEIKCPYQVGQKIFCKESFAVSYNLLQDIKYLSDSQRKFSFFGNDTADWKKRPAQHMKQEHSRLFLRITKIKVERLQDINEEDARLEGFPVDHLGNYYEPSKLDPWQGYARASFSLSWDPTHKKPEEKFYANPFVWVVDFKINK